MYAKFLNSKLFSFIFCYRYFPKNKVVKPSIQPDIRPDIRYPALTGYPAGYPAGYPVSSFWLSRISGRPDIRQKWYPVHP
jgi:hypothetical protein